MCTLIGGGGGGGGGGGLVWARICLKSLSPLRLTWSSNKNNYMKDLKGTATSVKPPLMATVFIAVVSHFFCLFSVCLFV